MSSGAFGCHCPRTERGSAEESGDVHVADYSGIHLWLSSSVSKDLLTRIVEGHNDVARGQAQDDAQALITLDLDQANACWVRSFVGRDAIPLRQLLVQVRGQIGDEPDPYSPDVPYPWSFVAQVQDRVAIIKVAMWGTEGLVRAILQGWMLWCDDHSTHATSISSAGRKEYMPKSLLEGELVWFWNLDADRLAGATAS